MVDKKAFRAMSYGVYIVSAAHEGKDAGCVVNTLTQVTSSPVQVSVAVNKENRTCGVIRESGRFEATVLAQDAPMELIGLFGFQSSADVDKFSQVAYQRDNAGVPYVSEHAVAHMGARVVQALDAGTHMLFVGEVDQAATLDGGEPLTYAYYHQVKGGKTPPKASSYEGGEDSGAAESADSGVAAAKTKTAWKCRICGYVVETEELPEDFKCPMCGMGREAFERIQIPA